MTYLIEKQEISVVKHSPGQFELHLPASGEAADDLRLTIVIKADFNELVPDLVAWNIGKGFV